MNKLVIAIALLVLLKPFALSAANARTPAVAKATPVDAQTQQLIVAYNYAVSMYGEKDFDQAKELFRKIAAASADPSLNGNSLYYYSQCAFRTGDYEGCVKGLDLLVKKWPNSPVIKNGNISQFAGFLIDQVTDLQTNWDYYRYKDTSLDDKGQPIWKESVPAGFKIKRINFKLGFGLYKILQQIEPNSPEIIVVKQKLDVMLNQPIKIIWADEKAPTNQYGHPADFYSILSDKEKKEFSTVICERLFYDWKSPKLYQFFDMYDDVENLKPKFIARTKPVEDTTLAPPSNSQITAFNSRGSIPTGIGRPPALPTLPSSETYKDPTAVLTLANLFLITGYNPYTDTFTNLIESNPSVPGT